MPAPARPCVSRRVKVPVDPSSLEKALAKKPFLAHYAGPEELKNLGQALGRSSSREGHTALERTAESNSSRRRAGRRRDPRTEW